MRLFVDDDFELVELRLDDVLPGYLCDGGEFVGYEVGEEGCVEYPGDGEVEKGAAAVFSAGEDLMGEGEKGCEDDEGEVGDDEVVSVIDVEVAEDPAAGGWGVFFSDEDEEDGGLEEEEAEEGCVAGEFAESGETERGAFF